MKSVIASVIALGSAALLSPAQADTYVFQKAIAVPPSVSNGAGGQFARFDISFFDPATQLDYVALQPRDQNVFLAIPKLAAIPLRPPQCHRWSLWHCQARGEPN